jgi:leucyl aminopeptidase
MRIESQSGEISKHKVDALVIGVWADGSLPGIAQEVNQATGGALARLVEAKEISGKCGDVATLLAPAGVEALQVLVVGMGKPSELTRGVAFRLGATAAKTLATKPRESVALAFTSDWKDELVESAVCGALVGCVGQDLYKSERRLQPFQALHVWGASEGAMRTGRILGEAVNLTRSLVNEPPCEIYPAALADRIQQAMQACGVECEVWDKARLQDERCGSLLAVARGSSREPRLVIMKYNGGLPGEAVLGLVGKGVTFDSGGLSIKPTEGMLAMKCDMAGAATVVGAMEAIARLKLPVNVIGLCGLVENMISGDAYKLGDVLKARNGKTIEVHNTDAEGRLVLADVLDVAVERGATRLIDLATLTGACVVALGNDVAGLMSNDQTWCDTVKASSDAVGEQAWQLPMFAEYGEQIRGDVADIKNVGSGRWGGAITAAKFLEEFVAGKPWTHIDIAGPAFLERSKPYLDAGASGAFVRTLVDVARHWN